MQSIGIKIPERSVTMQITEVREYIPPLWKATAVSKIHKGFSYDGKYLVYEGGDEPVYVLRTAALIRANANAGSLRR
jgi:hypothetical protein